ncbi:NAD(P)-dependent alcohol dehydrogenase [Parvularcula sp. ZS-1/3]|uniref:alcohol dehydrogenase (NADP(+)) n=1 Tax=Parvularcula mediterranea TaxID=2732508 RepID=A0A7Y3RNI6_9PROT|nr:NAD(P)-dependent alcohol dehydrogenase [Parvularcula mediterranea]NNU17357.1 NAD(P)-dependent alcohol dehydrogenase [Parvularcula mediterranea]
MTVNAYAAMEQGGKLEEFTYEFDDLKPGEVELEIESCGICHSDMSMIDNEWGMSRYPLVPGHEVVGKITKLGEGVRRLKEGQRVGLGWFADSCQTCRPCLSGHHNLCSNATGLIVGRHGGFADKIRASELWCIPIPDEVDAITAGPLFCGGATVFNPLVQYDLSPMDRIGIIGIGGLGHLALQFANAWGCEVTAFTTSDDKAEEAKNLGAHRVENTRDGDTLKKLRGTYDLIVNTTAAELPWSGYMTALCAKGRFVTVGGFVDAPLKAGAFDLIGGEKKMGGSSLAPPVIMQRMLEFCGRHGIAPMTETFSMKDCNDGMDHLRDGKARYRVVLTR